MSWLNFMALCLVFGRSLGMQCRDENNNIVDWFVMYKLPRFAIGNDPLAQVGEAYTYITSATVSSGWQLSSIGIDSPNSMLGNTLAPLYNRVNPADYVAVLYSDHAPNGNAASTRGHAKGVLMADATMGFWLVHSVPRFPPVPDPANPLMYSYPQTAKRYGQSALCISVDANQVETIATQLTYNEILTYHRDWGANVGTNYPTLLNITNRQWITTPPYFNKETIRSMGGLEFVSFAKGSRWNQELYHAYVAPELNCNMVAQTWTNGRGKIGSTCTGNKVLNVASVNIKVPGDSFYIISSSGADHSKWAASSDTTANGHWVCIGDINRATPQADRGGGTVCVKLPQLWASYADIVNSCEMC